MVTELSCTRAPNPEFHLGQLRIWNRAFYFLGEKGKNFVRPSTELPS